MFFFRFFLPVSLVVVIQRCRLAFFAGSLRGVLYGSPPTKLNRTSRLTTINFLAHHMARLRRSPRTNHRTGNIVQCLRNYATYDCRDSRKGYQVFSNTDCAECFRWNDSAGSPSVWIRYLLTTRRSRLFTLRWAECQRSPLTPPASPVIIPIPFRKQAV